MNELPTPQPIKINANRTSKKMGFTTIERKILSVTLLSVIVFFNAQYPYETQQYFGRYLSINLGNGECEWTAPVTANTTKQNTTTLLVSYPGSGKRLCWRILEALTGYVSGDDWNLSLEGYDTLFMKTSYPHPEGVWGWGDSMDQVILLIRNPRWAIPSYHTMRYEIDYSTSWDQSYAQISDTYTMRPPDVMWVPWRNERFNTELDRWAWHIDFWMQDGLRRNDGFNHSYQDGHCGKDIAECIPKTIIQFEKIIDPTEAVRIGELNKIGLLLDSSPNVTVIKNEARPCVYRKVWERDEFYNPGRDGNGPPAYEKVFTFQQLNAMRWQINKLKEKYSLPPFQEMTLAQDLVAILDEYDDQLSEEYKSSFKTLSDYAYIPPP